MKDYASAFWFTVIPIGLLSTISLAGNADSPSGFVFWFIAAIVWVGALGGVIVSLVTGRRGVAGGIAAGLAIGLLILAATCFANLSSV